MSTSAIEWTDTTWNPTTGCTRVSAGCDRCYAVDMTRRQEAFGREKYAGLVNPGKKHFNGVVRCHPHELARPHSWKRPRKIFVNSMSDLLHPGVPLAFVLDVFAVMRETPRHAYQLLTKRPERLAEVEAALEPLGGLPGNVLVGVSVEDARVLHRLEPLRACGAALKFVSAEPLLGSLAGVDLTGIDWLIAGGESGPGARRMDPAWPRELRDACAAAGVAYFFKQWGAVDERGDRVGKGKAGRLLDGREWNEHPRGLAA